MGYDIEIGHRDAVNHQAVEALSRLKTKETDSSDIEDAIPVIVVTTPVRSQ